MNIVGMLDHPLANANAADQARGGFDVACANPGQPRSTTQVSVPSYRCSASFAPAARQRGSAPIARPGAPGTWSLATSAVGETGADKKLPNALGRSEPPARATGGGR